MRQHGQRGRTCTPPALPPMMKERHDGSFKFKKEKELCLEMEVKHFYQMYLGLHCSNCGLFLVHIHSKASQKMVNEAESTKRGHNGITKTGGAHV